MDIRYTEMNYPTNNKPHETNSAKVYINPNFHSYQGTNYVPRENVSMHFNPKFSNHPPPAHNRITGANVTRIFINPNFVKPAFAHGTYQHPVNIPNLNVVNNAHSFVKHDMEQSNNQAKIQISTFNKSRYSIVRHGPNKVNENKVTDKPSKTIKISKYKSVLLSDIKNTINVNNVAKTPFINVRKTKILPRNNKFEIHPQSINKSMNRFKFVKCKALSEGHDENKRVVSSKVIHKKNYKIRTRATKRVFKKNNIPCPLFKKFGKCIRNSRGNCEFLHDKKHVALCRKFLKGICMDNNCLLSHDVTTNKMPTCYFYLKGMCTKVDCPYIHVKLNENTKICPDFLKGYCDKGNKCSNRHVSASSVTKKQLSSQYKNTEKTKVRKKLAHVEKSIAISKINPLNRSTHEEKVIITENRYYQDCGKWDEKAIDTVSEVLKPTRCKLGSLPSFIQLK